VERKCRWEREGGKIITSFCFVFVFLSYTNIYKLEIKLKIRYSQFFENLTFSLLLKQEKTYKKSDK
jgi:hypothetical protein